MTARILHIDIETKPALVWTYGLWDQNIGINQIEEPPDILGWATRWDDEPAKSCEYVWADDFEAFPGLHDRLDHATHVVHFNGKTFDMPWINQAFIKRQTYGGRPPSPYKQVDLMAQTKRISRNISNKLQWLSTDLLGLEGKIGANALDLWLKMYRGDEKVQAKARADMERYCKQDVNLLVPYLNKIRPWLTGLNLHMYQDDPTIPACPNCQSTNAQRRGVERTAASVFPRFQCQDCGKWFRGTQREAGATVAEIRG